MRIPVPQVEPRVTIPAQNLRIPGPTPVPPAVLAELAQQVIVINSTHYGRVEDAQMGICHMLCYAFMENPELGRD